MEALSLGTQTPRGTRAVVPYLLFLCILGRGKTGDPSLVGRELSGRCPPRCSVVGLRLLLPSSSAAGERKHMPLPRCHPSSRCALEAESGSSSPISTLARVD